MMKASLRPPKGKIITTVDLPQRVAFGFNVETIRQLERFIGNPISRAKAFPVPVEESPERRRCPPAH